MPEIFIIAGCNGAGKTTAAFSLLPDTFTTAEFVNADEIARGLSPLNPGGVAFQAGRIMLKRINSLMEESKSFAFETTLSGMVYSEMINIAKKKGYTIILFFLYLNSVELAKQRVALRVSKGGHNIPVEVIERRYEKGLKNLSLYKKAVNQWYMYDNSEGTFEMIAKNISGENEISNFDLYKSINNHE